MYALLGLGGVTATWGLMRALDGSRSGRGAGLRSASGRTDAFGPGPRAVYWAFFVLGSVVTLYTHNLGASVLLALHMLVLIERDWRRQLWQVAVADLGVLTLFSPWLLNVLP